jgi:hypothetical protein
MTAPIRSDQERVVLARLVAESIPCPARLKLGCSVLRPSGAKKAVTIYFGSGRNPAEALAFESRGGETGGCVQPVCDADCWRRLAQKARAAAET